MPTAAQILARRLYNAGCRFAFGIPGGEVLTVMDALVEAGIRFQLTKHENCAGFMAEGTYHATGAPGILVATVGPGVANAVNVIANAHQDRVPLIVLSGCVDPAQAARYTHQVFDHGAVLREITKATLMLADGAVDAQIDTALAIAMDGRPGPVHIDVPISLAAAEQPDRAYPVRGRTRPTAPAPGPDLAAMKAMLAKAERPVMVAGVDVLHHGAEAEVAAFCHRFGVPLLTTYKAKGVLPEDDPLSLGGHGLSPLSDSHVLPVFEQADLVLLAGYDPIEMRAGWTDPWDPAKAIEFVAEPSTHAMHHAAWSVVCDIGAGLRVLGEDVTPRDTWPNQQLAGIRAGLAAAFDPGSEWGPAAVFAAARAVLPPETVVTTDSGAHRILLSQMWCCPLPRGLLQSSALCTMGCALPLAIGYKLAQPAVPVISVIGDACLEMVLGELATLRDLALPIAIIVLVDESLALIEKKQRASGYGNLGVDFPGTDFPAVARALGGHGVTAADGESLQAALRAAPGRDTFTLIACPIGRKAYDGRI